MRGTTVFQINPDITEAHELRARFSKTASIKKIISPGAISSSNIVDQSIYEKTNKHMAVGHVLHSKFVQNATGITNISPVAFSSTRQIKQLDLSSIVKPNITIIVQVCQLVPAITTIGAPSSLKLNMMTT